MTSYLALILGSAAVGALVSSVITLFGQHIERKARREELLLSEAVKMAMAHNEQTMKIAELSRTSTFIPAQSKLTQAYFIALRSLITTGKLPQGMFTNDTKESIKDYQSKYGG